jgi:hypothetical protein
MLGRKHECQQEYECLQVDDNTPRSAVQEIANVGAQKAGGGTNGD